MMRCRPIISLLRKTAREMDIRLFIIVIRLQMEIIMKPVP